MNRLQTFTQALKSPTGWAGALLMAAVLVAPTMQGPEDHQGEWAESESLKALQDSEAGSAKRQAAAQALCNEARGPQSEARWLVDGSLACTVRRPDGVRKAQVQL